MRESKPQQHENPDDIDLLTLVDRGTRFLRRNRLLFIIALIVGVSLGVITYSTIPSTYKSRIILHSTYLTNSEQIQIINYWNDFLKAGENKILEETFHCSDQVLCNLTGLKASEIQKVYSTENPNGFFIEVIVRDNSVLNELQKAIVYGLNNTEYSRRKSEARKDYLNDLIGKVRVEISKLDSVKSSIEEIIINKEQRSPPFILDVTGINRQLIEMNEKLLAYSEQLKFADGVQVLQGFVPVASPVGISLKVMILLGIIFGIFLASIIALIRNVLKNSKKRIYTDA